jgi:DNA mismatch endonuclease (patch repair protein)
MTDVFNKEKRSQIMASVKNKNSKAELKVRSLLHKMGYRFRLHRNDLPGKPDIVMPKHKTIIFVHGCFWHSHNCKNATIPKSNQEYWTNKFEKNKVRFLEVKKTLQDRGWAVFVIWECETKNVERIKDILNNILKNNKTI